MSAADTQCTSLSPETAGMACKRSYPNKTSPGLCAGCELLSTLSGEALRRTSEYPRCGYCGTIYKPMTQQYNGKMICGTCATLAGVSPTSSVTAQEQAARAQRMLALSQQGARQRASNRAGTATIGAPNAQRVFISADVWVSGAGSKPKQQSSIGRMGFQFDLNAELSGTVIPRLLQALEGAWGERHQSTLKSSHIKLRFHGNAELLVHELDITIEQFIQAHRDYPAAKHFPASAKYLTTAHGVYPAFIYFEFHIQADLYFDDTGETVQFHNTVKRKAKDDRNDYKRARTSELPPVSLQSTFRPRDIVPKTLVTISRQSVSCNTTGEVQICADSEELTSPSHIRDARLAKGTMKMVYQLDTPDESFALKRFYRISNDNSPVSVEDNSKHLTEEILLVAEAKYFLEKFYEHGETYSADLDTTLSISQAWLATEKVAEGETPSVASGISDDQHWEHDEHVDGITWLMEPLRSGHVTKFRGTLGFGGVPKGKLAATVDAFIHFTYLYSQKTMVLCDIQTMKQRIDGRAMNVIFDPMVHSLAGNRGPGDHGNKGIQNFIGTHDCNVKCRSLRLEVLEDSDDD
ncbi:kinase-like domain-containing protein [Mycena pura]|uniref:Kinase-like domain-containing protein n=1 Tax=Mycena pura TaxID=153505 RepID=A0AAD6VL33_9AGAR|nr:kinase-like domain-containing protein [Mycena pura]